MTDYRGASQAAFDQQAATYDQAGYSRHAKKLYPFALAQLGQIPHEDILDLGCGTGELLSAMLGRWPDARCAGLDLSENMLAVAQGKLGDRVELVQGDAAELPYGAERFDVVLCSDSFHHYPEPERVFSEVRRTLKPGGVFLLGDTTAPWPVRGLLNLLLPFGGGGDVHLYDRREITELLSRHFRGVECRRVDATSFFAWGIK